VPYNIFRKIPGSPLVWLETLEDIEEVKKHLMKMAPTDLDDYLVWDLENHRFIEPFAESA
jgi:hypothetical protein